MSAQPPREFGALLRHLRSTRGWTQEHLAREAGLTITSVSNLERGETKPASETIDKLAAAFGCEPCELDPRRLAKVVAEEARTIEKRRVIARVLALPDPDIEAIAAFLDQRGSAKKPRGGK